MLHNQNININLLMCDVTRSMEEVSPDDRWSRRDSCRVCGVEDSRLNFKFYCPYCMEAYYCSTKCRKQAPLFHNHEGKTRLELAGMFRETLNALNMATENLSRQEKCNAIINECSYSSSEEKEGIGYADKTKIPEIDENMDGDNNHNNNDDVKETSVLDNPDRIEISQTGPWKGVVKSNEDELGPGVNMNSVYGDVMYRCYCALRYSCSCVSDFLVDRKDRRFFVIQPKKLSEFLTGLKGFMSRGVPHFKQYLYIMQYVNPVYECGIDAPKKLVKLFQTYDKESEYLLYFKIPLSKAACRNRQVKVGTCVEDCAVIRTPQWGEWSEETHKHFPLKVRNSIETTLAHHDSFPNSSLGNLPAPLLRQVMSELTLCHVTEKKQQKTCFIPK